MDRVATGLLGYREVATAVGVGIASLVGLSLGFLVGILIEPEVL